MFEDRKESEESSVKIVKRQIPENYKSLWAEIKREVSAIEGTSGWLGYAKYRFTNFTFSDTLQAAIDYVPDSQPTFWRDGLAILRFIKESLYNEQHKYYCIAISRLKVQSLEVYDRVLELSSANLNEWKQLEDSLAWAEKLTDFYLFEPEEAGRREFQVARRLKLLKEQLDRIVEKKQRASLNADLSKIFHMPDPEAMLD